LASELVLTEERERRRLAADLHDHIGQIPKLS
jgi:signal transduction histidine kinase